jgi:hypothetical protein
MQHKGGQRAGSTSTGLSVMVVPRKLLKYPSRGLRGQAEPTRSYRRFWTSRWEGVELVLSNTSTSKQPLSACPGRERGGWREGVPAELWWVS